MAESRKDIGCMKYEKNFYQTLIKQVNRNAFKRFEQGEGEYLYILRFNEPGTSRIALKFKNDVEYSLITTFAADILKDNKEKALDLLNEINLSIKYYSFTLVDLDTDFQIVMKHDGMLYGNDLEAATEHIIAIIRMMRCARMDILAAYDEELNTLRENSEVDVR